MTSSLRDISETSTHCCCQRYHLCHHISRTCNLSRPRRTRRAFQLETGRSARSLSIAPSEFINPRRTGPSRCMASKDIGTLKPSVHPVRTKDMGILPMSFGIKGPSVGPSILSKTMKTALKRGCKIYLRLKAVSSSDFPPRPFSEASLEDDKHLASRRSSGRHLKISADIS